MTTQTTQEQPVGLPGAIDDYLYGYAMRRDCGVCVALDKQFKEAERRRNRWAMYEAAAEIRNHHTSGIR